MNYDAVPSIMSAIAAVAAAYAALGSLRVSRESKLIAEQSALAVHHGTAAIALTTAARTLIASTETYYEIAYNAWSEWPSEIEAMQLDHRSAGGSNPRPLRHVLSDASEMLVKHGIKQSKTLRHAQRSMYKIVRDGVYNLNDVEYEKLLKKADGSYSDFEGIFGAPSARKSITNSTAFRWAYYQLNRRIEHESWRKIWKQAWLENGSIYKFRFEHSNIKLILESIISSLKLERDKLSHSVFPLESNPSLCLKYDDFLEVVEVLLDDCSLDSVEFFSEKADDDDLIQLIVYSMGIAYLVTEALNRVRSNILK